MTPPPALSRPPAALVVLNGDDVYEDLFSAGLLAVHASNVFPSVGGRLDEDYRTAYELIGSRYVSHGPRPHESRFVVESEPGHLITRDREPFAITHEHYQLELAADAAVVAWRRSGPGREPILHVRQHGRGRVCYLQLGHDMRAWDDPFVRTLITRAARWAVARASTDKEAAAV